MYLMMPQTNMPFINVAAEETESYQEILRIHSLKRLISQYVTQDSLFSLFFNEKDESEQIIRHFFAFLLHCNFITNFI